MECQYCKIKCKNVRLHQKRSKHCLNIQNELPILYEKFNEAVRDINKELIVKYGNEIRKIIGNKFDLIFD